MWKTERKVELLAPAGSMEALRAAVQNGCDAVYLGGSMFGARAFANNFDEDEIQEAIAYAHVYGVRVFVTVNTLIREEEFEDCVRYVQFLYEHDVDAVIIQDLGLFSVLRQRFPDMELHASTQMHIHNPQGIHFIESCGASRVVVPRETPLKEIRAYAALGVDLEVFVQGALCVSYSGQCLMSSLTLQRSGNRGECAQPCRWGYYLMEEKRPGEFFPIEEDDRGTFIMNAKDLNMLAHLQALADAGVDSIKIEGRNKKAFYVATVVGAYRRALDGEPPEVVADELLAVSHRPYGTGFYFSEVEQATAYDGYEQETMHVADVVASSPRHPERSVQREVEGFPDDPQYLYLLCRNRFAEGDELETLVPHEPSRRLIVRDLHWLNTFGPDNHDEDAPATVKEALSRATATDWEPAAAANRSCNLYRILVGDASRYASDGSASAALSVSDKAVCDESAPFAIPEGSFLRKRTFRRSARHEDKERL